jgi:hypothetical protein
MHTQAHTCTHMHTYARGDTFGIVETSLHVLMAHACSNAALNYCSYYVTIVQCPLYILHTVVVLFIHTSTHSTCTKVTIHEVGHVHKNWERRTDAHD